MRKRVAKKTGSQPAFLVPWKGSEWPPRFCRAARAIESVDHFAPAPAAPPALAPPAPALRPPPAFAVPAAPKPAAGTLPAPAPPPTPTEPPTPAPPPVGAPPWRPPATLGTLPAPAFPPTPPVPEFMAGVLALAPAEPLEPPTALVAPVVPSVPSVTAPEPWADAMDAPEAKANDMTIWAKICALVRLDVFTMNSF